MPTLVECARAHATEGEMVEALQAVWGSYTRGAGLLNACDRLRASHCR